MTLSLAAGGQVECFLRWYKIKVTLRWEDDDDSYPGIPARVVQYEVLDIGRDRAKLLNKKLQIISRYLMENKHNTKKPRSRNTTNPKAQNK
ncbi:hypothetical protein K1719_037988 [Acacia pycnantha]|nr:hypothetical protein K1719_037988 [Acacia pycnantha]